MVRKAAKIFGRNIDPYIDSIRRYSDPVASKLLLLFDSLTEFDEDEAHDDAKERAVESFQQKFAERCIIYLPLILISLVAITVIDFYFCWQLSNQLYGLVLDLIGAAILGRGLVMGGVAIGAVGKTNWDYNPLLVETMAKDSVDGVWGMFLLLIGVLIQIIAFTGFHITVPAWLIINC